MSDVNDLLYGQKAAPALTLKEDGETVTFKVIGKPRSSQERKFVKKGVVGPLLFWQKNKPTTEDELNPNLPHQPMMQVVTPVQLKDGSEATIYWGGEKLKALKKYLRENPQERLDVGSMGKLTMREEDTGAPQPKKKYDAVIKAPKED